MVRVAMARSAAASAAVVFGTLSLHLVAGNPALPGDPKFYVKLKGIQASEGDWDVDFKPSDTDKVLRIDNTKAKEVTFSLMLDLPKYNPMYCPKITINDKPFNFSPLEPLQFRIPLADDIAPIDKVWRIKLADPNGAGGGWLSHPNEHEYAIRLLQPPNFERVVEADSIKVTAKDGTLLESQPPFSRKHSIYRYHVHNSPTIKILPKCDGVATAVRVDGDAAEFGQTVELPIVHAKKTVQVQCQYLDPMWTNLTKEKSYTLRFQSTEDLGGLKVWLRVSSESGYCASRPGHGGRPKFVCRTDVAEPKFVVTYNNVHADLVMEMAEGHQKRLEMGISTPLKISHKRQHWRLLAFGDVKPKPYDVTVIWAADCDTYQCSPGLIPRPTIHSEVKAQSRLCLEEKCARHDEQRCCVETAKCPTLECPDGKILKRGIADTHCVGLTCGKVDVDTCCDLPATCGTFDNRKCTEGSVVRPDASSFSCEGHQCRQQDADLCCQARETCDKLTCPSSFIHRAGADARMCKLTSCEESDQSTCCDMPATCESFSGCPPDKFLRQDAAKVLCKTHHCTPKDEVTCCKPRAGCDEFTCAGSTVQRQGASHMFCETDKCGAHDDEETCCDVPDSCKSFDGAWCASGQAVRQDARSVMCSGKTCSAADASSCCRPRHTCEQFGCPPWRHVRDGAAGILCRGTACGVHDANTCCMPRASCDKFACPGRHVLRDDEGSIRCRGSLCGEHDVQVCCELPKPTHNPDIIGDRKAKKHRIWLIRRRLAYYDNLGCHPHPGKHCAAQQCYFDPTCLESPPRHGGLGCYAGGLDQRCRFCGFGQYEDCPKRVDCFTDTCANWGPRHHYYCAKYYKVNCQHQHYSRDMFTLKRFDQGPPDAAPKTGGSAKLAVLPMLYAFLAVCTFLAVAVTGGKLLRNRGLGGSEVNRRALVLNAVE